MVCPENIKSPLQMLVEAFRAYQSLNFVINAAMEPHTVSGHLSKPQL
jgi:hypothetical protein